MSMLQFKQIQMTRQSYTQNKKLTFQKQLTNIFENVNDVQQWFKKLIGFFSISIENIQQFTKDNFNYSEQFASDIRDTDEDQCIGQFYSLINSFGIQLSYFQKNSKFVHSQFQLAFEQIIRNIKSSSLYSEIAIKTKQTQMQQSIIDVANILNNLKDPVRQKSHSMPSITTYSSKSLNQDKQNISQLPSHWKLQQFLLFFQKMIQKLNQNTKQFKINFPKSKQVFGTLIYSLNHDIVFHAKKLHEIISSLFKSLLQQISNRFLQFKTHGLSSILNSSAIFAFQNLEISLIEYNEFNIAGKHQETWLKVYLINLRRKLFKRNQFYQKYYKLIILYNQVLKNITKNRGNRKQALKLLSKNPSIIHEKTNVIIESIQATSACVVSAIQKLNNQLINSLKDVKGMKSTIQKIDKFTKNSINKIQDIEFNKNPRQICTKLLQFLKIAENQEKYLIKEFQESIEKNIQQIFMSFSEIQSKLVMINQTYFGLAVRDTLKLVKNWSKAYPQQLIGDQLLNQRTQTIIKANNILLSLKNKYSQGSKKLINFQENSILLHKFYGIYNKQIGVLNITNDKILFEQINSGSIIVSLNRKQIFRLTSTNTLLQINSEKNFKFNLFHQTAYVLFVLKKLFLRKDETEIRSQKSIDQQSTLQNSSQQEQYKEDQDQSKQPIKQSITEQEQKNRQIKLKEILYKKFQTLNCVQISHTNCIHILNVLFGNKQFNCNGKKINQFYLYFKQKAGQLNVKPQDWNDNPMKYITSTNILPQAPLIFTRNFRFDHPIASMGIPFIPKTCNSHEIQKLILVSKDKFMVQSEVRSTGAPYTDSFILRVRSIFSNILEQKVKLEIMIDMQWVKRTMMKSMVQKQGYGETKTANQIYIKILNQSIKAHPIVALPVITKPQKIKQLKTQRSLCSKSKKQKTSEVLKQKQRVISNKTPISVEIIVPQLISNVDESIPQTKQFLDVVTLFDQEKEKVESIFILTKRFFFVFLISVLLQYYVN